MGVTVEARAEVGMEAAGGGDGGGDGGGNGGGGVGGLEAAMETVGTTVETRAVVDGGKVQARMEGGSICRRISSLLPQLIGFVYVL